MSEFWDEVVGTEEVQKNDRGDVIKVSRVRRGRSWYVDVRTWYRAKESGELLPGKGIAIPEDLADEVAELILRSGAPNAPRREGCA